MLPALPTPLDRPAGLSQPQPVGHEGVGAVGGRTAPRASLAARLKVPRVAIVVDRLPVMKHRQAQRPDARRAAQRRRPQARRDERKGWRWRLGRHDADLDAEDRQKRRRAFAIWPELAQRHGQQEECRTVDERQPRRTAIHALDPWSAKVPQTGHKARLKGVETVRRWEQELLTDVDERITNGVVEGTHHQIKLSKRRAFGFRNVETFRSRILHEGGGL